MPDTPATASNSSRKGIFIPFPAALQNTPSLIGSIEARGFWLAVGALLALWFSGHLGPLPNPDPKKPDPVVPATEFFRLGTDYRKSILASYADAIESGASQIAAGIDVDQALTAIGNDWTAARSKSFNASVAPALERISPNRDKSKSAELSKALRDFAAAMRAK